MFFQYVEKLEKILRFVIKEKALSLEDLDNIWSAQVCVVQFSLQVFICLFALKKKNQQQQQQHAL